ncbi:RHS domain-containing protein [Pseudomonas chlororaphis]|uniref:RHS repeat-associated core domain-containing protein n=1 Tax=Pseudomonas chlororaphis TaxID=587753 RepID=UPI0030D03440
MSGKPAARITDKVKGGRIITGSRTVLIGSQGGLACSECPGGITVGSPVNPQLGAKVLLGAEDLDFALPGAMPVVWQRQYSSYVNREHGAACGLLGHGWQLLQELSIQLKDDATLLFDASGRVITFDEALVPGGQLHSASEDIWLMRGGDTATGIAPWAGRPRWCHVEPVLARDPGTILAASGDGSTLWCFGQLPSQLPGALPGRPVDDPWRLLAQFDSFGRSQRYHYSNVNSGNHQDPIPAGRLIGLSDGAGRRYRLLHQRIHGGKPAQGHPALWGADDGWRLAGVDLVEDPLAPVRSPIALVRYTYSAQGDLIQVHDRAGQLVREFEWSEHRISAHRHASGPWHRYRYESAAPGARVVEHSNQEGLAYRFEYQKQPSSPQGQPRASTRVSDSLGRIDTYHFEGEPGLSRLTAHHKADGSVWRHAYDGFGRLVASTDPLGRSTYVRRDSEGRLTGMQLPDGSSTQQDYDEATGRLLQSTDPDGASTTYEYDRHGRLAQVTQADGAVVRYRYPEPADAPQQCDSPRGIEDARGGLKRLAWSDAGQLLSYTDCSGHSTHYHYDRWGALIETTNALGQRLRHERDAQGRIIATELPGGQTERYHYDDAGRLTRIDPPQTPQAPGAAPAADSSIQFGYDLWGRLTSRSRGGLSLAFEYDLAGRLTRLVNENDAQSRFAWDALDRLVLEEGFDGRLQRYEWDAAGQLTSAHDGNAQVQASTRYRWDAAGRLAERIQPATAHAPAQTHRYEWDAGGRMLAASVWLQEINEAAKVDAQLQSRIELQRDLLGRVTAETQRLYRPVQAGQAPLPQPELEFEHTIAHQLDALGNRQGSSLQGVGDIAWLLYGSGHVHSLEHNGRSLIDFERDALHREVSRNLHPADLATGQHLIVVQRQWDHLDRLAGLATQGLEPQAAAQAPPLLVGQLTQRRYQYDALGQLIGIEQGGAGSPSAQLLRYGYDAAGRLRAAADSLQPQAIQRWDIDAAGNRLPSPAQQAAGGAGDWAAQVHAHWKQSEFNLLGQGLAPGHSAGPVQRWPDNRIGYGDERVWRYDACGNRTEQIQAGNTAGPGPDNRTRQQLRYDGSHQLIEVRTTSSDGAPERSSRYTYDALGRRLKRESGEHTESGESGTPGQQPRISYFGWDGDLLVHTEYAQKQEPGKGTRQIEHTVYEPGSFTPLLRLSTTAEGSVQDNPHPLLQVLQADVRNAAENAEGSKEGHRNAEALAQMQSMLKTMPQDMQRHSAQAVSRALRDGLPAEMQAVLGEQAEAAGRMLDGMSEKLRHQQQKEHARIAVHYYHCDHLGMPLALTDQQGKIVWAAKLDPWGNLEQEYNPQDIDQPIRLPGQHHDRDTNLYYNRHRYYDPRIGSYINQDPIGWLGGRHFYTYPIDPLSRIDATGLNTIALGAGGGFMIGGPPGAVVGGILGGLVLIGGAIWMSSSSSATPSLAETLSDAHRSAAGSRTAPGYGGNCTPDEHDALKQKQEDACGKTKNLTCAKGAPDYGKVDTLQACADARIKIARKCFAGGDSGHNDQIDQIMRTIGRCMGR